uniref:Sushi domain-containing protein n=1 Tax=Cyprinus carpio TaxID=7962 RepID=A0A8C1K0M1_CYPCA
MHMLVKLIFITAAYMYNIARASGVCGKPELPDNTEPVPDLYTDKNIGETFRIKCAKGYIRKAGTSSLIRCTQENGNAYWHSDLPLKCIPDPRNPPVATTDPRNPHVATTETQSPPQQFTSSTTERTARKHPTLYCTSSPTTATGHIALTTTNEVVTNKTRRTTSQPTLMNTRKETESITTTNETTTSYTSREYVTTTTSHTPSGSFTTTGVNTSERTSTISEGRNTGAAFSDVSSCECHLLLFISYTQKYISPLCAKFLCFFFIQHLATVGGVIGIILLCLVAAVFIFLWLRHRNHRNHTQYHPKPDPYTSYIAVPVCASEHSSAQSNKAENSAEGSVIDKNPGIPQGADTCDELLPQTDS